MKKTLLGFALAGLACHAAFAEVTMPPEVTEMFTQANSLIELCRDPLSGMMLSAFGIVLIFVAYKLAKRAINKV